MASTFLLVIYALKCIFLLTMFYLASKAYYVKENKVSLILYLFLYYMFVMVLFAL